MADLGCSANAAFAFDYLVGRGLQDYQAAAIIGNLQLESHLEPNIEAIDTNGLPSRGIAMWQPARWDRLLSFATATGRDPWTLYVQLDYLWYELESFPDLGLTELARAQSLEDATITFQNRFERPKQSLAHTDRRIDYARAALFACPAVVAPQRKLAGVAVAGASILALVAAAAYGAHRAWSAA